MMVRVEFCPEEFKDLSISGFVRFNSQEFGQFSCQGVVTHQGIMFYPKNNEGTLPAMPVSNKVKEKLYDTARSLMYNYWRAFHKDLAYDWINI